MAQVSQDYHALRPNFRQRRKLCKNNPSASVYFAFRLTLLKEKGFEQLYASSVHVCLCYFKNVCQFTNWKNKKLLHMCAVVWFPTSFSFAPACRLSFFKFVSWIFFQQEKKKKIEGFQYCQQKCFAKSLTFLVAAHT